MKRLAGSNEYGGAGRKCWDSYRITEVDAEEFVADQGR